MTNSLFLNPVTSDELVKLISSLKSSNAQGWDGVSIIIGKKIYSNCISVLLHVISLSFLKGIFSKEMKIAKVIPLYKNDFFNSFEAGNCASNSSFKRMKNTHKQFNKNKS